MHHKRILNILRERSNASTKAHSTALIEHALASVLKAMIVGTMITAPFATPVAAQVVAPDSTVAGKTMGEWVTDWALWQFSEPEETNPAFDDAGEFQHLNQEGPVWFLPGQFNGGTHTISSFNVPSDRYLFAPIVNAWVGSPEVADDLEQLAADAADGNDSAIFELDGFTIPEDELLADYRAASGGFHYHLPGGLADPEEGYVAFDGSWVMLEPLTPGEHMLHTGGGVSSIDVFGEVYFTINSVAVGDFDANGVLDAGDIDLLSAEVRTGTHNPAFNLTGEETVDQADRTFWIHDLKNTWFGDSNLDGEFGSEDMVAVFQAGKYELDEDAGWAEGDWTGDQRFGSEDMVAAFQDGGYELGARAAVSAVPEPSSAIPLGLAMIGLCRLRRRR